MVLFPGGGGKEHWILKLKKSMIAQVLNMSKYTLNEYIRGRRGKKKLRIRGIEGLQDICELYHQRRLSGKIDIQ